MLAAAGAIEDDVAAAHLRGRDDGCVDVSKVLEVAPRFADLLEPSSVDAASSASFETLGGNARPLGDGAFLARRRPAHGLLASTVELPGTPWTSAGRQGELADLGPVTASWRRLPGTVEQVFTHFALTLTVYAGSFEGGAPDGHFWVTPEAVGEAGFSSAMRKAVEHALRRG